MTGRKKSFNSIANDNTRLVILGSMPGDVSLEKRQYYANPTNQFWRLAGAVIKQDIVAMGYEERLHTLLEAGVGLWDVVKSARRDGSSDNAIRQYSANSLMDFASTLPNLKALAFNGGKPAAIGRRQMPASHDYSLVTLPSSSAAYCSISYDRKLAEWFNLRTFLS